MSSTYTSSFKVRPVGDTQTGFTGLPSSTGLSLSLSRSDKASKCLFSLFSPKDDDQPHLDEPDTLSALPGPLVPARQEADQEAGGEDPLYVEVAAFNRPVLGIILARINLVLLSTVLFSFILKSKFNQSMFQSWR